jgi:protein SCO1
VAEARRAAPPRILILVAALGMAALLAAGAFVWLSLSGAPRGIAGSLFGRPVGGPFRLVDQDGKTVTDRDLRGKWLLVYFGYTHCPDECPTALNNIALMLADLGAKAKRIRPVFITVDPARDTPAVLKAYVKSFDAPILALTGSAAAVAAAAKAYHVYYARHALSGGDYEMDHSSIVYVMNPKGQFTTSFSGDTAPKDMAARLDERL